MSKRRKAAGRRRGPTPAKARTGARTEPGRPKPPSQWNATRIAAAALILALVIGLVATALMTTFRADDGGEVRAAEVTGESLPAFSRSGRDRAEGQPVPAVTGTDHEGQRVRFGPEEGATIVLVVSHWCPECRRLLPVVRDWVARDRLPDGVQIRLVSTAEDPQRPNHPAGAWLQRERWTAPVVVDTDGAVADALGAGSGDLPLWVFVGADGRVAERRTGPIEPDEMEDIAGRLT